MDCRSQFDGTSGPKGRSRTGPEHLKTRFREGSHIRTYCPSKGPDVSPTDPSLPMVRHLVLLLLVGSIASFAPTATAQSSNVETVEGPNAGEETTLTITPHALNEDVSARALGVASPSETRWALTLIGVTRADSIRLTLGDEALPIEEISRPAKDEVGPTRLYLSQKTFLTVAETEEVRLHVGESTMSLPAQMRKEMQQIFDTVL